MSEGKKNHILNSILNISCPFPPAHPEFIEGHEREVLCLSRDMRVWKLSCGPKLATKPELFTPGKLRVSSQGVITWL